MKNKDLKKRIIEISYRQRLSHLGSCLTAVDIIDNIYSRKKKDEPFINSSAHNSLALYVVLEKYENFDAEYLFKKHGVHCNRDLDNGIWFSGGSLGHGIGASVGFALADRKRNVYCLVSDGEMAEGSVYEALRIAKDQDLQNIDIYVNDNGYGAYGETFIDYDREDWPYIDNISTNMFEWPHWLQALKGHYHVMSEDDYKEALEVLK